MEASLKRFLLLLQAEACHSVKEPVRKGVSLPEPEVFHEGAIFSGVFFAGFRHSFIKAGIFSVKQTL